MSSVSVIIPFYQAGKHADRLAMSLKCQTHKDFAIIVVDDGQGVEFDELYHALYMADLLDRTTCVSSINNLGPGGARNLGLTLVDTRFVAFLDADDEWRFDYLEEMLAAQAKTGASFLVAQVIWCSGGRSTKLFLPPTLNYFLLLQSCPIQVPAVLLDLSSVNDVSFPEVGHEDYALWLNILKEGRDAICVQEFLVNVNRLGGSVSSNKIRSSFWHWNILKSHVVRRRGVRCLLWLMYIVNALAKRIMRTYKPIFLPASFVKYISTERN